MLPKERMSSCARSRSQPAGGKSKSTGGGGKRGRQTGLKTSNQPHSHVGRYTYTQGGEEKRHCAQCPPHSSSFPPSFSACELRFARDASTTEKKRVKGRRSVLPWCSSSLFGWRFPFSPSSTVRQRVCITKVRPKDENKS